MNMYVVEYELEDKSLRKKFSNPDSAVEECMTIIRSIPCKYSMKWTVPTSSSVLISRSIYRKNQEAPVGKVLCYKLEQNVVAG